MTTTAMPPRHAAITPAIGLRAKADAVARVVAEFSLWFSLMLVSYWWIAGGGLSDLGGWASGLTSLGRITGLIASVLLLAQVLLMARIPVLERAWGQDKLTRIHRWVGFASFNLMLVHIAAITWGYAGGQLLSTPGTLWNLTWTYPGMLLAAGGTLCLFMVVLTSIRAARSRMRYESWHLLHLYAYLGVGLALPHQLWTGQEFTSSPGRTVFWWTAWIAAAGAVIVWRLGIPLAKNLRHQLRVEQVREEGNGLWSVTMSGRQLHRLKARPGQFFNWRFGTREGWTRANPYSLSAAPDGRSLRITVQAVGDGSDRVRSLAPGTRVFFEGPYGRLTDRPRTRPKVAFIGAGVGTTPLRSLAEGMPYARGEACYLVRSSGQAPFAAELDDLAHLRGLQVLHLVGPRRHSTSWLPAAAGSLSDLDALRYWIPDVAARDVYVCGPRPWANAVRETLRAAGLPDAQLHVESFSH